VSGASVRACFWFHDHAEEAARAYVDLLPRSRIDGVAPIGPGMVIVDLTLRGAPFQFFQGGPHHTLNDAASISVLTDDQAETDRLWAALTQEGTEIACGWLRDRFGVAWQIVPRRLTELARAPDRAAAGRAMTAMRAMKKIDVPTLEAAFRGEIGGA